MEHIYSKSQKLAIEHGIGPLMVLAGPGSGKTFVITHRVRYLIQKYKVSPYNILVVTFSKSASLEMKERFETLMQEEEIEDISYQGVSWGTFHSIFFGILRRAYGYHRNQVATEEDKIAILQGILSKYCFDKEESNTLHMDILAEISMVKEERIILSHYYARSCATDIFHKIYQEYEEGLAKIKKIDFEDMLVMTYDLLEQREDIRIALENRYQYILIDEFQDINHMQYQIIKKMVGKSASLTIVGDDDQSIYRFRGAKPEIMLGFQKDYPNVKTVLLDINFRSSYQIVSYAQKLIGNNKERFKKEITAARGDGKRVDIIRFPSVLSEIRSIIHDIKDYISMGMDISQIAILYRTNIQPRLFIEFLMQHNIPFLMKDNIPNLYEHWIARDFISYLKLAFGIGKRSDWLRIINRPNRYIKREVFSYAEADINSLYEYYSDKKYMLERIQELEHGLRTIASIKLGSAIRFIRKGLGYDTFLLDYARQYDMPEDELFDILEELEHSASRYNIIYEWFEYMEEYKQILEEKRKNRSFHKEEEEEGIHLMTFHSSKGLEYQIVYIIDANNGITPHRKARTIEDIEEERRMFYVAMTRAKDRLCIYSADANFHKKAEISDFVKELLKK